MQVAAEDLAPVEDVAWLLAMDQCLSMIQYRAMDQCLTTDPVSGPAIVAVATLAAVVAGATTVAGAAEVNVATTKIAITKIATTNGENRKIVYFGGLTF